MSDAKYRGKHQATRKALEPYVAGSSCCRCGRVIEPGQPWDLDHDDTGTSYLGAAHASCNRSHGAAKGNRQRAVARKAKRERINMQVTQWALGLEVSESRDHTSIVGAGKVDDTFVLVELAAYLDGVADAVGAVLGLREERDVIATVVDPHSGASNLIKALTDAGVAVTEPTTANVAAAHAEFLDLLAAGRLRHISHPALDAAARHGTQRPLGGAQAWQRRGTAVDISPLTAATLALWGMQNAPKKSRAMFAFVDPTGRQDPIIYTGRD